ncbi:unnamed protein product [Amoebophrya sp. A120]|nr:unnamed protein product [Amoebophrya sp. A120]|eukprot:GSA120T00023347001.1
MTTALVSSMISDEISFAIAAGIGVCTLAYLHMRMTGGMKNQDKKNHVDAAQEPVLLQDEERRAEQHANLPSARKTTTTNKNPERRSSWFSDNVMEQRNSFSKGDASSSCSNADARGCTETKSRLSAFFSFSGESASTTSHVSTASEKTPTTSTSAATSKESVGGGTTTASEQDPPLDIKPRWTSFFSAAPASGCTSSSMKIATSSRRPEELQHNDVDCGASTFSEQTEDDEDSDESVASSTLLYSTGGNKASHLLLPDLGFRLEVGEHQMYHGRMQFTVRLLEWRDKSPNEQVTLAKATRSYSQFKKLHKTTNSKQHTPFLRRLLFSSHVSKVQQRTECLQKFCARLRVSDRNLKLLAAFLALRSGSEEETRLLEAFAKQAGSASTSCTPSEAAAAAAAKHRTMPEEVAPGVANGCGCEVVVQATAIDDDIAKHYKKGGWFGAVAGAFGDKKTMYCHHITRSGGFAVKEAKAQGLCFSTETEVWEFLGKKCGGRFTLRDWGTKTMGCGGLGEKDHDETCNTETCLFLANNLKCPVPRWAIK